MSDRELTELAAKAAGLPIWRIIEADSVADSPLRVVIHEPCCGVYEWNPLTDDGDALRLAVKLRFEIKTGDYGTSVRSAGGNWHGCESRMHGGIEPATRRAIVRAAAEIGKQAGKQK